MATTIGNLLSAYQRDFFAHASLYEKAQGPKIIGLEANSDWFVTSHPSGAFRIRFVGSNQYILKESFDPLPDGVEEIEVSFRGVTDIYNVAGSDESISLAYIGSFQDISIS